MAAGSPVQGRHSVQNRRAASPLLAKINPRGGGIIMRRVYHPVASWAIALGLPK